VPLSKLPMRFWFPGVKLPIRFGAPEQSCYNGVAATEKVEVRCSVLDLEQICHSGVGAPAKWIAIVVLVALSKLPVRC
jgi:hypothetical protein